MASRLEVHFTSKEQQVVEGEVAHLSATNRMASTTLVAMKIGQRTIHINPEHVVYVIDHGPADAQGASAQPRSLVSDRNRT